MTPSGTSPTTFRLAIVFSVWAVLCVAAEDMDQPYEAHARGQLEAHIAKTEKSEKRKEETLCCS